MVSIRGRVTTFFRRTKEKITGKKDRTIAPVKTTSGFVSETQSTTGRGPTFFTSSRGGTDVVSGGGGRSGIATPPPIKNIMINPEFGGGNIQFVRGTSSSTGPTITERRARDIAEEEDTTLKITAGDEKSKFVKSKVGFGTATKVATSRGKQFVKERFDSPINPNTLSFADIFSGFRQAETQKFERPSGFVSRPSLDGKGEVIIQTDTTGRTEGELTFAQAQEVSEKNVRELAEKISSEAQSQSDLEFERQQQRVDAGKVYIPQAQKELDIKVKEIQQTSQKRFKESSKTIPTITGLSTRKSKVEDFSTMVLETALIETGIPFAVSSKQDPLKIKDISDITSGKTSIEGSITSRPSTKTAVLATGPLVGAGARFFRVGRAIEQAEVGSAVKSALTSAEERALLGKPSIIRTESGNLALDVFSASGKGEGQTFASVQQIVLSKTQKDITQSVGKELVVVKGRKFFSQKPFIVGAERDIVGRSATIGTFPEKELTITLSKLSSRPSSQFFLRGTKKGVKGDFEILTKATPKKEVAISVIKKKGKDDLLIVSGKLKKFITPTIEKGGIVTGKLPVSKADITFSKDSVTLIRRIKKGKPSETSVGFLQPSGGTQTPLSKTFGPSQLSLPKVVSPKLGKIKSPALKPLTTGSTTRTTTLPPSTIQVTKQRSLLGTIQRSSPVQLLGSASKTKQRGALRQKSIVLQSSGQILKQASALSLKTPQLLKQKQIRRGRSQVKPRTPRVPGLGFGFTLPKFFIPPIRLSGGGGDFKPRRRKRRPREEILLVQGFTAKTLGLGSIKLKTPKDIEKALRIQSTGGIRLAPKLNIK